jgi:hypothetical protein
MARSRGLGDVYKRQMQYAECIMNEFFEIGITLITDIKESNLTLICSVNKCDLLFFSNTSICQLINDGYIHFIDDKMWVS